MFVLLSLLTVGLFSVPDVSAASTDNQSSYQTAFIYFLPDYQGGDPEKVVNETNSCQKLGYTYTKINCVSPYVLKNKCPSGEYYKECYCAGEEDCAGASISSNPYTETTGTTMKSCTDCSGNTKYNWACNENGECDTYTLDSCPERGFCSRCCNGKYKLESCDDGYHVSGNACEETCIPASDETGCSYGTHDCADGCGGTRKCCSDCTTDCALGSCPEHGNCKEECGLYCLSSCELDYAMNGNTCEEVCTKKFTWCQDGYYLENICTKPSDGKEYGDCINCMDETAPNNPCAGKYTCSGGGRTPDGPSTCTCGSVLYYDKCLVEETCKYIDGNDFSETGGTCMAATRENFNSTYSKIGYYEVKSLCTKIDGTEMIAIKSCNYKYKDCSGNYAPAKGMTTCENDVGVGNSVKCGGKTYYETCQCPYIDGNDFSETGGTCMAATRENFNSTYSKIGYYEVKSLCTKTDGTEMIAIKSCNYKYKDCSGNYAPAKGMTTCENDVGVGNSVKCGGKTYYETCQCPYIDGNDFSETGGTCMAATRENFNSTYSKIGYYEVKSLCTKTDGTEMIAIKSCNYKYKDCSGNYAPAKGMDACTHTPGGTVVECGGKTYATECWVDCSYEYKQEDCEAQGKTFVSKCHDRNNVYWGECN